ncbi:MAG: asparaginyl/glutamyl-tRNA amidotransferase subunit C [Candidatus Nealsonbacteria bacterium RIFCSPLOWO2_01_FULL_43_36]|nr:MAG: asparaginyl/glutamyl-tRNA amidotransferase subunit C [Candidatus Nealsonbacteria bacterium RIFCSPLOWO2_01_FULL_43_36]
MITKEEVQHIAALARLSITKKEEGKFRQDLSAILDYIEKLKKVDITETKETSHPLLVKNIFRKDEVAKTAQNLLKQAPVTQDDYIKVKSILK